MNEFLTRKYVEGKLWFQNFKNDEAGVSPLIATVLILLVVALLAVAFWGKIEEWFDGVWSLINEAGLEEITKE